MNAKWISSLEKCFWDETVESKTPLQDFSLLRNERFSVQLCYRWDAPLDAKQVVQLQLDSPLAPYITLYRVKSIPSMLPVYRQRHDSNYLRTQPGLYPDLLEPMGKDRRVTVSNTLGALWLELEPNGTVPAGTYPITCRFADSDGSILWEQTVHAQVIGAELPPQQLIFTQWFYTDCLLQYYGTQAFDERHWQIIENFMKNAARYGMNMILTPVLTPELDTYVGGERPTTQLVQITRTGGSYCFDFSRLGRWVDLCDKVGIRYLEINHFFTQWGAAACPKVIATVDGVQQQIFGWDTPSDSPEYRDFLYALIPQMLAYLKAKNNADRRCYFHISDEPRPQHIGQYTKVCNMIRPLLEGYPIMDALSDYSFYANGCITCPVPALNHIQPFLEHGVQNLWTYYCCTQNTEVSNRFFAMPSARNRIIGTQLYKFRIAGFLHWGYNFYNNQYSYATVNPFLCSDAEQAFPSGDSYSVYPGPDGQPWPSLRQVVFYEALQDMRALQLCETLYGREQTLALVEQDIPPITFREYPRDAQYLQALRSRINAAIAAKL